MLPLSKTVKNLIQLMRLLYVNVIFEYMDIVNYCHTNIPIYLYMLSKPSVVVSINCSSRCNIFISGCAQRYDEITLDQSNINCWLKSQSFASITSHFLLFSTSIRDFSTFHIHTYITHGSNCNILLWVNVCMSISGICERFLSKERWLERAKVRYSLENTNPAAFLFVIKPSQQK